MRDTYIRSILFLLAWIFFIPVTAQKLTPELLWNLKRVGEIQVSPDQQTILFTLTEYNVSENKGIARIYRLPARGGTAEVLFDNDKSLSNPRWRPDGKAIGFLMADANGDRQWFEVRPNGSGLKQVTQLKGGIANVSYAPNGNHLAFTHEVKLEKTVQDLYPDLQLAEAKIIDDLMYRHWDHWSDAYYSHVFIMPYDNGKVTGEPMDLMPGEPFDVPQQPFGGTEDIAWHPSGSQLAYACKKLRGKDYAVSTNTDIYLYDLPSQTTTNLTEGMDGYDTHPVFSPSGDRLGWLSMARDGYESDQNELYTLELESNLKTNLTAGYDETIYEFIWTDDGNELYFLSPRDATYQLFSLSSRMPANTSESNEDHVRQITHGTFNYLGLQWAGKKLVAPRQSMSSPTEIFEVNPHTGAASELTIVNEALLDSLAMGKVEKRMVTATDGAEILTWVIYPPDFDPEKEYPALLYCQGGPQSAVSQFFSYRWNFQLMAAKGYIVVAPNRRGLPSFGAAWNEQISGDWGGQNMQDYLSAIDAVATEPFVDEERLGCIGASYGGYSVYYLAGIHEKRFKTFISHCGLFNLSSWYGTTEELFFANWDLKGAYWDDPTPKSFQEFSPHLNVDKWDTPIMVIHGEKDYRVPVSEGMQAFQAAQLQGIPSRFLYFPNEGHWVLGPQNGVLWHREFFRWLEQWLK